MDEITDQSNPVSHFLSLTCPVAHPGRAAGGHADADCSRRRRPWPPARVWRS